MKKVYFLFAFVLFASVAFGQVQSFFDFTSVTQLQSWGIALPQPSAGTDLQDKVLSLDGTSVSFIKNSASVDSRIWNNKGAYELRTYKGSQVKITSARSITRVEFEFGKDKGLSLVGTNGKYAGPTNTESKGIWTGNATEIIFDSNKTVFKRIIVYEEVGKLSPMPVFSHESGTYFSSFELTVDNEKGLSFLISYDYQVYRNGNLVNDATKSGGKLYIDPALIPGQVTTYDVDVQVRKGKDIPSQKVRKTYVLRERGPERIFEKVTSIKQMTLGSNFIILNNTNDRVMSLESDNQGKYMALPCQVNNNLVNTGEIFDPMILTLLENPGTENYRFKLDGQEGYLCFDAGGTGLSTTISPEYDLSTEWKLRPTDLQIENAHTASKYVTYYAKEDKFNLYSRIDAGMIAIYKERVNGRPLPKYCPVPKFSLKEGAYVGQQNLEIKSDLNYSSVVVTVRRDGVIIRDRQVYDGFVNIKLDVFGPETTYDIEAMAICSGYGDSEVVKMRYVVKDDPFANCLKAQILIKDVAVDKGWSNSTKYASMSFYTNNRHSITFEITGGGNNGKYYASDQSWRLYTDGQMKITLPRGYYFNHIKFFMSKGGLNNATWSNGKFYPNEGVETNSWAPSELLSEVTLTARSKVQFTGFNIYYTSDASGVEAETTVDTQFKGVKGGIQVIAGEETAVAVYTLSGQKVGQFELSAGETMIELPRGFYIVGAGNAMEKVIVK